MTETEKTAKFTEELRRLLNRYSAENASGTPDYPHPLAREHPPPPAARRPPTPQRGVPPAPRPGLPGRQAPVLPGQGVGRGAGRRGRVRVRLPRDRERGGLAVTGGLSEQRNTALNRIADALDNVARAMDDLVVELAAAAEADEERHEATSRDVAPSRVFPSADGSS